MTDLNSNLMMMNQSNDNMNTDDISILYQLSDIANQTLQNNSQDIGNKYLDDFYILQKRQLDFLQSTEYKIITNLQIYFKPILIVLGTIGNIFTARVLYKRYVKQNSASVYLLALAITNTLILNLIIAPDWIHIVTQTRYIANTSDWMCRIWKFYSEFIKALCIWLVVAMTVDRFIFLWYPLRAQSICTVFIAKVTTVLLIVFTGSL
ncbi:unnamed protein product, partial [Owenia fusiformis]